MTDSGAGAFVEAKRRRERSGARGFTLRVVLDTCILKLATFRADSNPSALIIELARVGLIEAWASPATLEEAADVLSDQPDFGNYSITNMLRGALEAEKKAAEGGH